MAGETANLIDVTAGVPYTFTVRIVDRWVLCCAMTIMVNFAAAKGSLSSLFPFGNCKGITQSQLRSALCYLYLHPQPDSERDVEDVRVEARGTLSLA